MKLVIEQSDLPGLIKLVGVTVPRIRLVGANGHKSADEEFWWACGKCFFERRKKSTIKAHVIENVCRKPMEMKKVRRKRQPTARKRHSSCNVETSQSSLFTSKRALSF